MHHNRCLGAFSGSSYCAENIISCDKYIANVYSSPHTPIERVENRAAPDVLSICKFPFGPPTTHVFESASTSWTHMGSVGQARMCTGTQLDHLSSKRFISHCHVKHQEHLLTATEIERISKEADTQFLKQDGDGTIEIKTPG